MRLLSKLSIGLLTLTLLHSCGSSETTTEPTTLAEKQQVLTEKQTQLQSLQKEIATLKNEIIEMSPELQEQASLVDTVHVDASTFTRYVDVQGAVITDDIVNVVSEIPGRITYLNAKEGQYIKKGALVATIDVESTQKQIEEVKTSLSLAQQTFDRQQRLWEQNIGSEIQYLQAKNNVERLEKTLETLDFQLTKANVYAPISGTVDMEMLKQGEVASPGMPIVTIMNTAKIKISTDLPERYLTILDRGDMVDLYFPSIDLDMTGRVTLMGRSIDPSNRTLPVEIAPAKYNKLLKPNLLAEIKIKELEKKDIISLPAEYVLQEVDGQEYVYLVKKNAEGELRAKKSYIMTGENTADKIIITEGLTTDDIVVGKGSRSINDGDLLQIAESRK